MSHLVVVLLLVIIAIVLLILYILPTKSIRNHRRAIKKLNRLLRRKQLTNEELITMNVKLSRLHYNGTPSSYDSKGRYLPGMEPNIKASTRYMIRAISLGYKRGYIELGRMFQRRGFQSNIAMARECFIKAADAMNDTTEAEEEIRANAAIVATDVVPTTDIDKEAIENIELVRDFILGEQAAFAMDLRVAIEPHEGDSQNVHDHPVVATVKKSIHNVLRAGTMDISQVKLELYAYVDDMISSEKQSIVKKVIDHIFKHGDAMTSYGATELEVLSAVWKRVRESEDKKEILIDELASGYEHFNVVCTMGRISRMINALNGIDNEVNIIHTQEIRKEMLAKAPIIRASLSSEDETELKEKLIETFTKDYVDTGLLTSSALQSEIDSWDV